MARVAGRALERIIAHAVVLALHLARRVLVAARARELRELPRRRVALLAREAPVVAALDREIGMVERAVAPALRRVALLAARRESVADVVGPPRGLVVVEVAGAAARRDAAVVERRALPAV